MANDRSEATVICTHINSVKVERDPERWERRERARTEERQLEKEQEFEEERKYYERMERQQQEDSADLS